MRTWNNREMAARELANALQSYRGKKPVVMAIPRGAVYMGAIIADALDGDLDLALVHKIGHPWQPELAVGAVDERGNVVHTGAPGWFGLSTDQLEQLADAERRKLIARRASYGVPAADLSGRTVILVDDGIATGATMRAAVHAARAAGAKEVVVASPVAAVEAAARLRADADTVVILDTPENFFAVGEFYRDFRQVEDHEVRSVLQKHGRKRHEPMEQRDTTA